MCFVHANKSFAITPQNQKVTLVFEVECLEQFRCALVDGTRAGIWVALIQTDN